MRAACNGQRPTVNASQSTMRYSARGCIYIKHALCRPKTMRGRDPPRIISSRARESRTAIIISARARASQCNNQAGSSFRVNGARGIRDFVFTSGHVRRIAEFAFSPSTCTRVSTRKHTHVDHYAGSYVTGFTACGTCVVRGCRECLCAFVYTGTRNGEYRRAILSESNEGYAPRAGINTANPIS